MIHWTTLLIVAGVLAAAAAILYRPRRDQSDRARNGGPH